MGTWRDQGKAPLGTVEHRTGVGKTQPIRVKVGLQGSQMQKGTEGNMSQKQGIQSLFDSLRRQAAQGAAREA
jgi:hypothetical protein